MNNHMEVKHSFIWGEAKRAEKEVAGIAVDGDAQPTISGLFASVSDVTQACNPLVIEWFAPVFQYRYLL